MIRKLVVRNFKRFGLLEFDLPEHLVMAGPNNSGKTTVLQAITAWSEIALQWTQNNRSLAREQDGNYATTNLNILNFHSVPLADFDHLWKDKDVNSTASISIHTDQWQIGFEILHKEPELSAARPTKDVHEDDLKKYIESPLTPVYIPPVSLIKREEYLLAPEAVRTLLAEGFGRDILRNLLIAVSQDTQKWKKLQEVARTFFGYELSTPSATAKILARYRHTKHDQLYDLSSAASGFLQVLKIYASLLYDKVSVLLIDEPDAHLHILLQEKIYRDLRAYARQHGVQLIIATHSEEIINAADKESLHILTSVGELRQVSSRQAVGTLRLENTEIMLALTEPGILYTEGKTDIDILREWARTLGHPLLAFLEKPFWRATAEERGKNGFLLSHFKSMRLVVPDFRGVELRDGDQGTRDVSLPDGVKSLCWQRYEIENYLIHPQVILRFVEKNREPNALQVVDDLIKKQLPQTVHEEPFKTTAILQDTKGKKLLSNLMQEAGIDIKESDHYQIAAEMKEDEIHPEVVEKLDAIAQHFEMMGNGA